MKILLVGNYLPDPFLSMHIYVDWLRRALESRGHTVDILRPEPSIPHRLLNPGLARMIGYVDKYVLFPPRLRRAVPAYDLVHIADHSNAMYLKQVRRQPALITCHDLIAIRRARGEFADHPFGWSGKLLQRWILAGLRNAQNVACVSGKTKLDLERVIGQSGARIRVIYDPLNWEYRPGAELSEALLDRIGLKRGDTYLLHVGGNGFYKNRPGVVRIFARLAERPEFASARMVMVGKPWAPELRAVVSEEKLEGRVLEAPNVSTEELQALYGNALFLLFPSLEEGFGWPVIEAQACGCPVVTSNRAPLTEVAGDAAIFVDPEDPVSVAAAIAGGVARRDWLREAGFRNLGRFASDRISAEIVAFYEEILRGSDCDRQS